jgi:homoserine dehydrogenase
MKTTDKINIGLFGYGCVGQGLHAVLNETQGFTAEIKKVCIKNENKKRPENGLLFTTQKEEVLNDPEINVVVELIDDAEAAFEIVKESLSKGKAVVSANKKMIAENLEELLALQKKHNTPFLYEGACCASIPIIRNLEEYYDNDLLKKVEGIFNGSTNYILSKIFEENSTYASALSEAQEKGFAETDPSLDVEGVDPKYKLAILLFHAFGLIVKPEKILNLGIDRLSEHDIAFAQKQNATVKLIAKCEKKEDAIYAYCIPQLVAKNSDLDQVKYEYNAVKLESVFSEQQTLLGKGAGDKPTGSAVLSDISALSYDYKYAYKKTRTASSLKHSNQQKLKIYVRFPEEQQDILNAFDAVEQRFSSAALNYAVGEIELNTLISSEWKNHPDIFVLGLN